MIALSPPIQPVVPGKTEDEKLTHTAERWVAQTFYGTLLRQMRESPFKSSLFDGGRGGQAFAGLFDQELAQRMSRHAGGKLVDSIVRKIEGKKAYEHQSLLKQEKTYVQPGLRA